MSDAGPRISINSVGRHGSDWSSRLGRLRAAFRGWRRTRPFWGGVWCILGGLIIAHGATYAVKGNPIFGSQGLRRGPFGGPGGGCGGFPLVRTSPTPAGRGPGGSLLDGLADHV